MYNYSNYGFYLQSNRGWLVDILNTVSHAHTMLRNLLCWSCDCHMIHVMSLLQFARHGGVQAIRDAVLKTENITLKVLYIHVHVGTCIYNHNCIKMYV